MRLRVCIITTARICDNPRVVKEADALAAAGHDVRVVAYAPVGEAVERDCDVLAARNWKRTPVNIRGTGGIARKLHWFARGGISRVAAWLFARGVRIAFVRDRAASKYLTLMAGAATAEPADLVVAHHVPALPAAARAAALLGAPMAFDAEDLHSGDRPDTPEFATERALAAAVEAAYLPGCVATTASSEGIANALVARYGIRRPFVVLNAFGIDEARVAGPVPQRGVLSLYWYSQVIGLDRGLQDVIRAMGRIRFPLELHLRGQVTDEVRSALVSMAADEGVDSRVFFHPLASPARLIELAAQYDVGLALEQPTSENKLHCVSNKLLAYLSAGIAVIATDLPGQKALLDSIPGVGRLYSPGDVRALAEALDWYASNPGELARAKQLSRQAALTRYNWNLEGPRLVDFLADAIATHAAEIK